MQTIHVVKTESKQTKTGNTMIVLFDEKNTRFSGFGPELQAVKEGDVVEAEIVVEGKYNNIKSVKVTGHQAFTAVVPQEKTVSHDADTRRSIERQTSINAAVALCVNPEETVEVAYVLHYAEAFYEWISEGKMPQKATETKRTVQSPTPAPSSHPDASQTVKKVTKEQAEKDAEELFAAPPANQIGPVTEIQLAALKDLVAKGKGAEMKAEIVKRGWTAKRTDDLNEAQADVLLGIFQTKES